MRPAMVHWWKHRGHGSHCGSHAGYAPGASREGWEPRAVGEEYQFHAAFGGGTFGVRRPLRFLAFKLGLDEHQVSELAKILDELKTERAQAAVDDRRAITAIAEALGADAFDEEKSKSAASLRVKSSERLQESVNRAMSRIHAILNPEQRAKLAYLIRTGALAV